MIIRLILSFFIFLVVFSSLEKVFPLHAQKFFRKGWFTDLTHFFVSRILLRIVLTIAVVVAIPMLDFAVNPDFQDFIASQPLWIQLVEAIVVQELATYFAHRLSHTVPWLWKFHAVHHSSEEIDWLSAMRLHPLDQTFTRLCGFIPLYLLGFNRELLLAYIIFGTFNAVFIHANVRFKFGPLKWIVATPEFHRWHHSNDPEVYTKNLAAMLPVIDLLFGTLYLPKGETPDRYGIEQPLPNSYIGQIASPFSGIGRK